MNVEPGGLWRYTQSGPEGAQYHFKVKFIEMDKPNRLIYDYGTDVEDAPEAARTNVTFEDENGKTKVTLQIVFPSAAEREQAAKYGAVGGAKMALENLANYVTKL